MQPGRGDYFLFHGWDGRICLINSGGSHHFVTARYLAGVARQPIELKGMLKGYLLNPVAVTALTEEYELFAITRDPLLWDELFESMRALQATWFAGDLPRPHNEGKVLLLPRADRRSMTVASRPGCPIWGVTCSCNSIGKRVIRSGQSWRVATANPAPWATVPPTGTSPAGRPAVRQLSTAPTLALSTVLTVTQRI